MSETLKIDKLIKEPITDNLIKLSNHLNRYYAAMRAIDLKGNSVIDVGCGVGYGAFLLAQKAWNVIGIDKNKDYIKYAKNTFKKDNLKFFTFNRFSGNSSKLVCIETIEHIKKSSLKSFVQTLLHLTPQHATKSEIFLTFPVGKNLPSDYNEFHLNEPSIGDIHALFAPHFNNFNFELFDYVNSHNKNVTECYLLLSDRK